MSQAVPPVVVARADHRLADAFQDIAEAIQAHTSTMDLTGQGAIEGLAYQLGRMAEAFERIATVLEHQGVRVTVGED